jgi:TRAP-type C4-dicarboxylate transport system substrate-binding protein
MKSFGMPFVVPSPDRPVTLLEEVLMELVKDGLLQKKIHGSIVWNMEGFETLVNSRR